MGVRRQRHLGIDSISLLCLEQIFEPAALAESEERFRAGLLHREQGK